MKSTHASRKPTATKEISSSTVNAKSNSVNNESTTNEAVALQALLSMGSNEGSISLLSNGSVQSTHAHEPSSRAPPSSPHQSKFDRALPTKLTHAASMSNSNLESMWDNTFNNQQTPNPLTINCQLRNHPHHPIDQLKVPTSFLLALILHQNTANIALL